MAIIFNPFTGNFDFTGNGTATPIGPAGGDLSGNYPNPTVTWINGYTTYDARYIQSTEKGAALGVATLGSDGYIPIAQMNPSFLERLYVYAGPATLPENAGLTIAQVQNGDVVKMNSTGLMYVVADDTQLNSPAGFEVFNAGTAASVPWTGITGIPANISSLESLTYASTSFVKMTAAGTFALDTNTYASSSDLTAYAKLDGSNMPFTGNISVNTGGGGGGALINLSNNISATGIQGYISNFGTLTGFLAFNNAGNTDLLSTSTRGLRIGGHQHGGGNGNVTKYINGQGIFNYTQKFYNVSNDGNTLYFYFDALNGKVIYNSSSQITIQLNNGIKIGNNTDSAGTAGGGSIKYVGGYYYGSNDTDWLQFITTADLSDYAKLDGTNQPFTGDLTIKSTNGRLNLQSVGGTPIAYFATLGNNALYIQASNANTAFDVGNDSIPSGLYGERFVINDTVFTGHSGFQFITSRFQVAENQGRVVKFDINPKTGNTVIIKGNTSDNTTKALSVTDSSNVEYFYLRNDGAMVGTGLFVNFRTQPDFRLISSGTYGDYFTPSIIRFQNSAQQDIGSIKSYFVSSTYRLAIEADYVVPVANNVLFVHQGSLTIRTTANLATGNWDYTGTAQNLLTITNGIKIGNNTDAFGTAGGGSLKYVSDLFYGATSTAWRAFAFSGFENNITTTASAAYTILSTDYIVNFTATGSHTLPSVASVGIGKVYRLFAKNVPTTINVAGGSGDTIDGVASANMVGYSMITLRAIAANEWRIGD